MKPFRNLRTKDGVALEILRKWETGECSTTAINLFTCWSRQWPNQHETSRISWIISLNVLGPPRRLAFERWLIAAVAFLIGAFQRFHQNFPRSSSFPVPLHSSWSFSPGLPPKKKSPSTFFGPKRGFSSTLPNLTKNTCFSLKMSVYFFF